MTRTRYKFLDNASPHFLTCTVIRWISIFTRPETVDILLGSFRFLINDNRLTLYGYVILENHLHLIASSPDLSKEIGDFKSFTARRIIDLLKERKVDTLLDQLNLFKSEFKSGRDYQLWQEGSHPQLIQSRDMMRQKLDYIHQNPVKRGYVDEDVHWRYSSARNYSGLKGLLEVTTDW